MTILWKYIIININIRYQKYERCGSQIFLVFTSVALHSDCFVINHEACTSSGYIFTLRTLRLVMVV